jgi:UDP-glucose 4-epimerase
MKVMVTGGAGFLGSHLIEALVERGDDVSIIDNFRRGRMENIQKHLASGRAKLYTIDIRDYPGTREAISGSEIVYHLAAQSNVMGAVSDMDYSFTTNVTGTFNVLKAAAEAGARRLIFSSSREAYGEPATIPVSETAPLLPKNPYGASKLAGEAYCRVWERVSKMECTVLRFANIYGSRDRDRVIPIWLDRARSGEDLEMFGGTQILDFIWVSHAVKALLSAATCKNDGPINIGSGRGTSLVDLAKRILAIIPSNSSIRHLPSRSVEVTHFVADISRMRDILGINPPTDPLDGLSALAVKNEN